MSTDISTHTPLAAQVPGSRQRMANHVRGTEKSVSDNYQAQDGSNGRALVAEAAKPVAADQLTDAVKDLERFIQDNRRELRFSIDDDLGRTVVTILDSENNVIRKIPSDEVLAIARQIKEASSEFDIALFSATT